jgi:hypothetical protein
MAAGWKDALMADTGAPWNIPYVEPADLVRDYPAADEAQALAIAAGLSDASIVKQVVTTTKTDTFSATNTNAFVDVTGLSVTITCQSTSSRVVVVASVPVSSSNTVESGGLTITDSADTVLINPDSPGSRSPSFMLRTGLGTTSMTTETFLFVHTPGVTTAFTYKVRALFSNSGGGGGSIFVNRSSDDTNAFTRGRGIATITAIEVLP